MSSILEAIKLTRRARAASKRDRLRRQLPNPIGSSCQTLLEEAGELGLDLDDVIDALRQSATQSNNSH